MTQRVQIYLQARPGKDDAIIEWWESLKDVPNRSDYLRAAIMAGIGTPPEQPTIAGIDPEALIERVRKEVDRELNGMSQDIQRSLPGMIHGMVREMVFAMLKDVQSIGTIAIEEPASISKEHQEFTNGILSESW